MVEAVLHSYGNVSFKLLEHVRKLRMIHFPGSRPFPRRRLADRRGAHGRAGRITTARQRTLTDFLNLGRQQAGDQHRNAPLSIGFAFAHCDPSNRANILSSFHFDPTGLSHAMRNEHVEELIVESVSGSPEEPNNETVKDGRVSGVESKTGRREEEERTSQEKSHEGSLKRASLSEKKPMMVKTGLRCCQLERGSKAFWDTEQFDRHLLSRWRTRVASEPLGP